MGKDWKARAKKLKKELKALTAAAAAGAAAAPAKAAKPVSPLAPAEFPELPAIAGASFAAAEAGVRYRGRTDVTLMRLAPGTAVAGVFTRSSTRAGCIRDAQAKLAQAAGPDGAAIIVNSGNSNAFTGRAGDASVAAVCAATAAALGLPESRVFMNSTGVIGEPLPHERIVAVVPELVAGLSEGALGLAARAIMTTDTFPKAAAAEVAGEGGPIRIAGIAKGSGMIAPDMATMLVYLFTDAALPPAALSRLLARHLPGTFNAITVDGDTSTSDALFLCATGRSPAAAPRGRELRSFETALAEVMRDLALQVVRDGEGATKLIEVRVTGAASGEDARRVAMAIANSPLVKTAVAGEDPNWGRIVMAVGKSGARADRDRLTIRLGDTLVARDGWRDPDYREEDGAAHMRGQEIVIGVDLGLGPHARTVWTCDLTHRYIDINADYRS
jgi:glutamate N-acetyltransferase/amino-acid N-acetyltransferase